MSDTPHGTDERARGLMAAGCGGCGAAGAADCAGARTAPDRASRPVTLSVELGVRQDGGDAETGTGLETGFGVVYAARTSA